MGEIIVVIIASTLGFFLIGVLPKPELTFPGSDRLDRSTRKRLGTFVVAIAYGVVIVGMLLVLHVDSIRNWIGVTCLLIGLLRLGSAIRNLTPRQLTLSEGSQEAIAEQKKQLNRSLSSIDKARTSILVALLSQSSLAVFLFYYLNGSRYFSAFDLLAFLFMMLSIAGAFLARGIGIKRKLLMIKTTAGN